MASYQHDRFDYCGSICFWQSEAPTDIVKANDLVFSILPSRLYLLEFELGENQNGILRLCPKYTYPKASSDTQCIYSKLIEAVIHCQRQPKKPRSGYIYEILREKKYYF